MTTYRNIITEFKTKTSDEILKILEDDTKTNKGLKGRIQEALGITLMSCNIFDCLKGYKQYHNTGFNDGNLRDISSLNEFFDLNITDKGSVADALFKDKKNKKILAFTFKNRNDLSIGHYDFTKIKDVFRTKFKSREEFKEYDLEIGVVCKDKEEFMKKIKNKEKSSEYVLEGFDIRDCFVIDNKELCRKWFVFVNKYGKKLVDDTDFDKIIKKQKKNRLSLKFHQKIMEIRSKKILEDFMTKEEGDKYMCNRSICRSGKSYMMYNDIKQFRKLTKKHEYPNGKDILVLTSKPDSIPKLEKDFKSLKDFRKKYSVLNLNKQKLVEVEDKIMIYIMSIQTLKAKSKKDLIEEGIFDKVGIVFVDEFHEGGSTDKVKDVLERYGLSKKIIYFLTATADKVIDEYKIKSKNVFGWRPEDIKSASILDEKSKEELITRHGEEVGKIFEKNDPEDLRREYSKVPTLCIVNKTIIKEVQEHILEKNKDEKNKDLGYSNQSLYMLDENNEIEALKNETNRQAFKNATYAIFGKREFEIICGKKITKSSDEPYDIKTFIDLCKSYGQRIKYGKGEEERPLILPLYIGSIIKKGKKNKEDMSSNIDKFSDEYRKYLIKNDDDYIENFHKGEEGESEKDKIVIKKYNSKDKSELLVSGITNVEEGFDYIVNKYKKAKLIVLLLGSSIHTAVTNKYCDWIKIFTNINSNDRLLQMVYRPMNESGDWERYGKKTRAIVMTDTFQPVKEITSCFKQGDETDCETFERVIVKQALIDVYQQKDFVLTKVRDSDYKELWDKITKNADIRKEMKNLVYDYNLDYIFDDDEKFEILTNISSKKSSSKTKKEKNEGVKVGVVSKNEKLDNNSKKKENCKKEEKKMILKEMFKEQFLDVLQMLVRFTHSLEDFDVMTNIIKLKNTKVIVFGDKKNISYYDLIRNQALISFPDLEELYDGIPKVDLLLGFIGKEILENEKRNKVLKDKFSYFVECYKKQGGNSSIDRYYMTLKFVSTTDEEKKNNAEVLTPIPLVVEMVSKIPEEFWDKKDLKILDPCVGKGAFLVVLYEKLLEKGFTRKEILEDVLYFGDINMSNVYIVHDIFNITGEEGIVLNYYIGDTLKLDVEKEFDLKGFDLVLGNPPYNSVGGLRKGGKNLYTPFTLKAFELVNKDGFILYVTPTGVLKSTNYSNITPVFKNIVSNEIIYIDINRCKKYFNIGSTFTYFLIRKNNRKIINKVITEIDDKVYSNNEIIKNYNGNFLPCILTKETISIINKCSLKNFGFKRLDNIQKVKKESIPEKFLYMKRLDHINYKQPYLKIFSGDRDTKEKGILYTSYSKNKEIVLKSKLMAFINILTRYDAVIYHYFINMFGVKEDIVLESDKDIYESYNLSKEEIEFINNVVNK